MLKLLAESTGGSIDRQYMMLHKVAVDIHGDAPVAVAKEEIGDVKMSDTGEIEWNNEDPERGMFIVRTPNVKMFTGFPEGRIVGLGDDMSLQVGETKLGWTTISLTSINATVTLASAADATSCWALDPSGNRMAEVPVSASADGKAVVAIDGKYQTVWYEIEVR